MKKIILVAYDLNPKRGTECGVASSWLDVISNYYKVDAFVNQLHEKDIATGRFKNVTFHFISINNIIGNILRKLRFYNVLNVLFISKVKALIKKEFVLKDFSFIHCITPLGVHSWNDLYKFEIPVLVGPVIGAVKAPKGFFKTLRYGYIKSVIREIYYWLIPTIRSWKNYYIHAKRVIIGVPHIRDILPKEIRCRTSFIFNCCVDTNIFVTSKEKRKSEIVKVLFVGQLINHKGVLLILEACKTLINMTSTPFKFYILGRGPLETIIRQKITSYGIQNELELRTDFISIEKLVAFYQDSDIFCFPSLTESGAMVILEAMACGLPIVTSNYGGPSYIVTDECGAKIDVDGHDNYLKNLTRQLRRLIENEDIRIKMGQNARLRVEKEFSVKALEEKILCVYTEMIEHAENN